jgi:hypothetical protein
VLFDAGVALPDVLPEPTGGIYLGDAARETGTSPANGIIATLTIDIPAETPLDVYPLILRGGPHGMHTRVLGPQASPGELELVADVLAGSITVTPEPASFALVMMSVLYGLMARRRRRCRAILSV